MLSAAAMLFAITIINAQETRPANNAPEARPADTESKPVQSEARPVDRSDVRPVNPQDIHLQQVQRTQEMNRRYEDTFRRDLNINDNQIGQIRTLHTETNNSYNTIDPKYFESNETYNSRVSEIMKQRDERLGSILTPEQYSRFNANRSRYNEIDLHYFPNDLEQRRNQLGAPDMRISPDPSNTIHPDPRPMAPGQTKPDHTPAGEINRGTPSETRPVAPNQGTTIPK